MKNWINRILRTIAILVIITIAIVNVKHSHSQGSYKLSALSLSNLEALGSCESEVQTKKGDVVELICVNSSGESYKLNACDFNPNYLTVCNGRPANT
jgi:hypothetical protein